jgi:hypothetical protein
MVDRTSAWQLVSLLAGCGLVAVALGQTAPQPDSPATPAGDIGLQEVIVTATKQAAIDVNKVPISISAYGQREMDTRGIRDIAVRARPRRVSTSTIRRSSGVRTT